MMNTLNTLQSVLADRFRNCDDIHRNAKTGYRAGIGFAMEKVQELMDTIASEDEERQRVCLACGHTKGLHRPNCIVHGDTFECPCEQFASLVASYG